MRYREIIETIESDDDLFAVSSTQKFVEFVELFKNMLEDDINSTSGDEHRELKQVIKQFMKWYPMVQRNPHEALSQIKQLAEDGVPFAEQFCDMAYDKLIPGFQDDEVNENDELDDEMFGSSERTKSFRGWTVQQVKDHFDELNDELYGYEAYWEDDNDPEFVRKENELKAMMQYARIRFGEDFYQYLSNWREYSDRQMARYNDRTSADPFNNTRYYSEPRMTKAGKMYKQDQSSRANRIQARLGRHHRPNLPESDESDEELFGAGGEKMYVVAAPDDEVLGTFQNPDTAVAFAKKQIASYIEDGWGDLDTIKVYKQRLNDLDHGVPIAEFPITDDPLDESDNDDDLFAPSERAEYRKQAKEDPQWAYKYARDEIGGRWPLAEPYIRQHSYLAYEYAKDVIGGRWPEAEPVIMQNLSLAVQYAQEVIGGRWPEAEPLIMKRPVLAYDYARDVIQGRWPKAEPVIMQNPGMAYRYARDVIKARWPEAEPYIQQDSSWTKDYKKLFKIRGKLTENDDDDLFGGSSNHPHGKEIAQELDLWLRRRQSSSRRPIIPSSEKYVQEVIAAFNKSFLKGIETWAEYPLYGNTDIKYDIREYFENSRGVNFMDYVDQVNESEDDDELFASPTKRFVDFFNEYDEDRLQAMGFSYGEDDPEQDADIINQYLEDGPVNWRVVKLTGTGDDIVLHLDRSSRLGENDDSDDDMFAKRGIERVNMRSIEIDGIDHHDAPDYSGAYVAYAEFNDGTELDAAQLDWLTDELSSTGALHDLIYDHLYESDESDDELFGVSGSSAQRMIYKIGKQMLAKLEQAYNDPHVKAEYQKLTQGEEPDVNRLFEMVCRLTRTPYSQAIVVDAVLREYAGGFSSLNDFGTLIDSGEWQQDIVDTWDMFGNDPDVEEQDWFQREVEYFKWENR